MNFLIEAAERGILPDLAVRAGIRRLLRERLREENRGGCERNRPALEALLEQMRSGPIALATDKPNEQHYEVPDAFFRLVLGPRMKYSCCLWEPGTQTLSAAEEAMLRLTCERAGIEDGQDVLELGCGWGSLTLWMAEHFPRCRILAVSKSATQREFIDSECRRRKLASVRGAMAAVHAHLDQSGVSTRIVYQLERMAAQLRRAELLLGRIAGAGGATATAATLARLVRDNIESTRIRDLVERNSRLLARKLVDRSAETGTHYIARNRREYFAMFRSAALGGFIIACMALFKLFITAAHLPPLTEALAVCPNYGLGFVLIHILHGTVATKQPAMTAATIAAGIDRTSTRQRHLDQIVLLAARTIRSQLVAILGNVSVAIPTAVLFSLALTLFSGHPYPETAKAQQLLDSVHPWLSGSLLFAGIAGVCLFLTGLISGYYDNLAAYNRIPQRLMALRTPRWLLGEACRVASGLAIDALIRWDATTKAHDWQAERVNRTMLLVDLARAAWCVGDEAALGELIAHVLQTPARYPDSLSQIPALLALGTALRSDAKAGRPAGESDRTKKPTRSTTRKPFITTKGAKTRALAGNIAHPNQSLTRWVEAVIQELESRTATPPAAPKDWRRPARLSCRCKLCRELQRFLEDRDEKVHRFPAANQATNPGFLLLLTVDRQRNCPALCAVR